MKRSPTDSVASRYPRQAGFFSIISILVSLAIMGVMASIVVKAMGDIDSGAGPANPLEILEEGVGTGTVTPPPATGPAPNGGTAASPPPATGSGGGSVGGAAGLAAGGVAGGIVAGAAGIAATGGGGSAPMGIRGDTSAAACQGDYQSVARALAIAQAAGGAPVASVADLVARGFLATAPAGRAYTIDIRPGPNGAPTTHANGQPSIAGCG
ncbi:MAG: hypothetical protein ACT4OS_04325 [Acidimicrobiales bacterium]